MLTVSMVEKIEQEIGGYKGEVADVKMYYCPKCGVKVEKKHRFCWYCGQSIKAPFESTKVENKDSFIKENVENKPKYTTYNKDGIITK